MHHTQDEFLTILFFPVRFDQNSHLYIVTRTAKLPNSIHSMSKLELNLQMMGLGVGTKIATKTLQPVLPGDKHIPELKHFFISLI